jgi:hypothetical protein
VARRVIGFHEVIHGQEVHSWSRGNLGSRDLQDHEIIVHEIIHGHEERDQEVING